MGIIYLISGFAAMWALGKLFFDKKNNTTNQKIEMLSGSFPERDLQTVISVKSIINDLQRAFSKKYGNNPTFLNTDWIQSAYFNMNQSNKDSQQLRLLESMFFNGHFKNPTSVQLAKSNINNNGFSFTKDFNDGTDNLLPGEFNKFSNA